MWYNFRELMMRVKRSTNGATLVYFALMLPVIVGLAGLGFDATLWFMEKRQLQSVADSSALAAAYSMSKRKTSQEILGAAIADAGGNNFVVGAENTLVISSSETDDFYDDDHEGSLKVTVRRPADRIFAGVLGLDQNYIESEATAAIVKSGEHCILALDKTRSRALEFTGSSNVNINCGVSSNSSSNEAIYLNGTATLTANPSAQAYGDIYKGARATLNTPNPIQPFSQRTLDPYGPEGENLQVPVSPAACTATNVMIHKGDPSPDPGRYCGKFTVLAQANVVLEPGVYIIDGGDFTVKGGATITGTDVTIILTGATPADIGTVKINGGAIIDLTAPHEEKWEGIVFFQDPAAQYEKGQNQFLGGAQMTINGAIYMPSQEIRYSGGSATTSGCLQLVGAKVTFSGNSFLYNDYEACDEIEVEEIDRTIVTLVK